MEDRVNYTSSKFDTSYNNSFKNTWEYYFDRALYFHGLNEYSYAEECYLKALNLNPESHEINYQLGLLNIALWNYNKSEEFFLESLKYNKTYVNTYLNLGRVYSLLNLNHTAIKYYNTAITVTNDEDILAVIYENIAKEYAVLENYTESVKYLKLSMDIKPGNRHAIELIYSIYDMWNRLPDLNYYFNDLLEIYYNNPDLLAAMGVIQYNEYKNYNSAIDYWRDSIEAGNNEADVFARLAEAHIINFNNGLALDTYYQAIKIGHGTAKLFYKNKLLNKINVDAESLSKAVKYAADEGDELAKKWLIEYGDALLP